MSFLDYKLDGLKKRLTKIPHSEIVDDGDKTYPDEVLFFAFAGDKTETVENYGNGYSGCVFFMENNTAILKNTKTCVQVEGNWIAICGYINEHFSNNLGIVLE